MTQAAPRAHAPSPRAGRVRGVVVVALAVLAFGVLAFFSLFAGSGSTTAAQVWAVLSGAGDEYTAMVVDARVPRTILGAVSGAALAVSGALIQAITRNPLGDPGYLGVTTGASAGVVAGTALLGAGAVSAIGHVAFAIPGALAAVLVVYALGTRSRSESLVPLVLAGAVVTAVLHAGITAVVLSMPGVFDSYRFWVVGSLTGADLGDLVASGPVALVGLVIAVAIASGLNTMALGDDMATSLGVRVGLVRGLGVLAATLLAAAATALTGPIAFLGLAVPHIVRAVVGSDLRWQIPASVFAGGALLIAADMLARVLVRPQELMVGIVTAFVGAPFLLVAVRRMGGERS
ncbi:MAG: FecCD family ABC transporter permease [Microbacterium sp.]